MPDPPPVSLVTRYVFENPWPLAGAGLAIGLWLLWSVLREGRTDRLRLAVFPLALALLVTGVGTMVTTAGEAAKLATRDLVGLVVDGDVDGALLYLDDDIRFHRVSRTNPALGLGAVEVQLRLIAMRFSIVSNRITLLRAYTTGPDAATVHLACWTEGASGGPTPTQWVLEFERRPGGDLVVTRLVWVSVNGDPPTATLLR